MTKSRCIELDLLIHSILVVPNMGFTNRHRGHFRDCRDYTQQGPEVTKITFLNIMFFIYLSLITQPKGIIKMLYRSFKYKKNNSDYFTIPY